jgi:hypothetical protein
MKYNTPELTALTPAINAIQGSGSNKQHTPTEDSPEKENISAYQDWE